MNNLIIREARLLFLQSIQKDSLLTCKICIGTKIHKFQNLTWDPFCKRWETTKEMKVSWAQEPSMELQIYYQNNGVAKILGEGIIDLVIFQDHFNQEIKIALTYEGIITGWLYCIIGLQDQDDKQIDSKFLCIYKISFLFMEDEDQTFKVQIFQNRLPIFQKQFKLIQKGKTIFPNLKKPIHYSDVISLSILHSKKQLKTISFLVDNIKRGKTTFFQAWIRNKHNNKIGDLKLEYFLQNLFLQNDRKIVSRKGLYNATYSTQFNVLKVSHIQNISEVQRREQSKQTFSHTKKQYQQSQQSTSLLIRNKKNQENQRLKPIKIQAQLKRQRRPQFTNYNQQFKINERTLPCLRQSRTSIKMNKTKFISDKQKKQFYFQDPLLN